MIFSHFRVAAILLALTLMVAGLAVSESQAASLTRFVDLDGDGFSDDLPDADFDGIPDEMEHHSFFSSQQNLILQVSKMSITAPPAADPKPTASERFGAREFATRGISTSRSDFDAGFGSGLGLGGGLGGGGACAGGVCF